MTTGPVIWLLGLSGSGKTTLGGMLVERLRASGARAELIDGDLVRDFFEDRSDYSRENRIANVKRIAFGAHLLARQGVIAVVANISPFAETRRFIRAKVPGYCEIYLKADLDACSRRDVKGLYKKSQDGSVKQMIGIDIPFEAPTDSDLVLDTVGESQEASLRRLLSFLKDRWAL